MSANFDWQTEDENNRNQVAWDAPPEPPAAPPSRWQARWRLIATLVVLSGVTAALVWWRVDQQVDANMQAMRNDVASSYNLLQRAAATGDEELFRSVLSGRDVAWTMAELELFSEGLLTDRRQLGLQATDGSLPLTIPIPLEEATADQTIADIYFSPDLTEAIVQTWHPYVYQDGDGSEQTVLLQQTAIFRQGGERWLFSSPTDEFWGDWETAETDRLTVIYPQRDREIALRLTDDLDALLERVCDDLAGISCDPSYRLALRFDREPDTLVALVEPRAVFERQGAASELSLPTPTLAGLPPAGEEALTQNDYDALLQAYSIPVAQAALVDLAGYTCCNQLYLFQVLADRQLAELGLRAWPVVQDVWDRVLDEKLQLSDIDSMWRRSRATDVADEEREQVYAAVDFLLSAFAPRSAVDMQRLLPISPNMEAWLSQLAEGPTDEEMPWALGSLDEAWWIYALQGNLGDESSAWPDGNEALLLSCTVVEQGRSPNPSIVYQFDPAKDQWETIYEVNGFLWMSPLPDPDSVLLQEFLIESESWRSSVWHDGERVPLYDMETSFSFSFAESDPDGRYVISYELDPQFGEQRALLFDLEGCTDRGCPFEELPGLVVWSSDGQSTILSGNGDTLPDSTVITNARVVIYDTSDRLSEEFLTLSSGPDVAPDAEGESLGRGYAPFWIDESTFGFIDVLYDEEMSPTLEQQIVLGNIEDPTVLRPIASSIDILAPLPIRANPSNVTFAYAVANPMDSNQLFIVGLHEQSRVAYVFQHDIEKAESTLVLDARYDLNHSLSFSPDGRFLAMTGRKSDEQLSGESNGVLYLHDLTSGRTIPFQMQLPFFLSAVSYDWTKDGRWLAIAMDDGLVALVSTIDLTVRTLPHELGNCTSVAWLAQEPPSPGG